MLADPEPSHLQGPPSCSPPQPSPGKLKKKKRERGLGVTEEFKVQVEVHQGSALSPFLEIDSLTDEVRQESLWAMTFADDIVICGGGQDMPRRGET